MELPKCRVKELRTAKGLRPADLASKVGITVTQLYNIESGRTRTPRFETVEKLKAALEASYSDLWPPVPDSGVSEAEAFRCL